MLAEAVGSGIRSDILSALKQASAATGSDFDYLLCTAMRESSLRPQVRSGTSSACGLFQFVEQTWFGLVKQFGAKHGLASFANAISESADGHFSVDNSSDRHAILALRYDPRISALMAGEYANVTRASMESALGRSVTNGELYAAHFLGPEAACRLIRMNGSQPHACAANVFPQAAGANRSVFYHSDGSAKSINEVYRWAVKEPVGPQGVAPSFVAQGHAQLPSPRNPSVDYPDDWAAMQIWAATRSGPPIDEVSLLDAPSNTSPDILDLLGTLSDGKPPASSK